MRGSLNPLDGRYAHILGPLAELFSERALMEERANIELAYLSKLAKTIGVEVGGDEVADRVEVNVDRIFELEKVTHHDVKAVELAVREVVPKELASFVHFGLTSQDINSLALTRQVRGVIISDIFPAIRKTIATLSEFADKHKDVVMLSHTHGQPATPTTLGSQFNVFVERLDTVLRSFISHRWTTKFGGATGGFNAHKLVYPSIDWCAFGDAFVFEYSGGKILRQQHTTQIEHYDGLGEYLWSRTASR